VSAARSLARLAIGVTAALSVACAPRIPANEQHAAMAPDTPDQVCLICHLTGHEDSPRSPHDLENQRYQGCPRCHGPRHRPAVRGIAE
jgi:hypothetical protein